MNIVRISSLLKPLAKPVVIFPQTRGGHVNQDWKAGLYPKTEEERLAAAKKYNLLPVEYEPYDESESGLGDYPKLPYLHFDDKSPYYAWDYVPYRRNFGEPVHFMEMAFTHDKAYHQMPPSKPHVTVISDSTMYHSFKVAFIKTFLLWTIGYLMLYYGNEIGVFQPVSRKHLPAYGTPQYTYPDFGHGHH